MAAKQTRSVGRGAHGRGAPPSSNGGRRQPRRTRLQAALAQQRIVLPCPTDVRAYLGSHPDLAKLAPAICAEARKEFGREAELTLTLYRDPEIKNRHLTLTVRLPSYDHSILERMDRVTQPFDDNLSRASGFLLVTTDLCSPRVAHAV
jgi:hypothetical protein